MNNTEKIEAIERWQQRGDVHPFTCSGGGGPGDHQTLMEPWAREKAGEISIILQCPECGYIQEDGFDFIYPHLAARERIDREALN